MKDITEVPKKIVRDDIELRFMEPTFENAIEIFRLVDRNREHLLPYLSWAHETKTKSKEDSFRFLEETKIEWDSKKTFTWSIFYKDEQVGNIAIHNIDIKSESCEFGYWLDKDATHKGIMTKAVVAVEDLFFGTLGFNRIVIRCDKRNTASANVAKRNGYTLEAEFRQDHFREYENMFSSTLGFSKLRDEYKKK